MPHQVSFERLDREILALIRAGRSAKKMAYELEVGVKTINGHVRKLCLMVEVEDRHELQAWLAENPGAEDRFAAAQSGLEEDSKIAWTRTRRGKRA